MYIFDNLREKQNWFHVKRCRKQVGMLVTFEEMVALLNVLHILINSIKWIQKDVMLHENKNKSHMTE